jgi:hypothetical protein
MAEDPIEASAAPFAIPNIYIPGNSTEVRLITRIDGTAKQVTTWEYRRPLSPLHQR